MTERTQAAGLQVATCLYRFIEDEALPAAGITVTGQAFWEGVAQIIADLAPVNRDLLRRRDELQASIDSWHRANAGQPHDPAKYRAFLEEIGYLVPSPGPFQIATDAVDPEIASIAGPPPGSRSTPPTPAGDRCMTRSTAPTRFPSPTGRPEAGPTTRCAASGWSRRCGPSSTRRCPSTARHTAT